MRWSAALTGKGLYKLLSAVCLLILALILQQMELFKPLDNRFYDAELILLSRPVSEAVVIIAIDDNSLKKLGKWPWSRRTHAESKTSGKAGGLKM